MNNYIYHHGIKGMRWGVRRYQNPDGSLTNVGRKRLYKTISKGTYKDLQDAKSKNKTLIENSISDKDKQRIISTQETFIKTRPTKQQLDAEDKAYEKGSQIAYKKTYDWFKKNDPEYLSGIEKLSKKDNAVDLTQYHDFRKTFEGFEDAEWQKIKPIKNANEDKAYEAYRSAIKDASKNIIGKYGNEKVVNIKNSPFYINNMEDLVDSIIFDIGVDSINKKN